MGVVGALHAVAVPTLLICREKRKTKEAKKISDGLGAGTLKMPHSLAHVPLVPVQRECQDGVCFCETAIYLDCLQGGFFLLLAQLRRLACRAKARTCGMHAPVRRRAAVAGSASIASLKHLSPASIPAAVM